LAKIKGGVGVPSSSLLQRQASSSGATASRRSPAKPVVSSRPTPAPKAEEGRLSTSDGMSGGGADSATANTVKSSSAAAAASAASIGSAPHASPLVGQRVKDLVASINPSYTLDADAEEQVLLLADDFLDKVLKQSIRLSKHRGSKTLDVQDIQLILAKHWGIVVPGLGAPNLKPSKPGAKVVAGGGSGLGSNKRKSSADHGSGGGSRAKKSNTGSGSGRAGSSGISSSVPTATAALGSS